MIKKLAGFIGEYKKDTILTPIYVALEVILEIIIPLLMAKLIDNGINTGNMPYILKIGTVLLVSAVLSMVFGIMAGMTAANASAGFAKNLRRNMYYNIQNFSFSNIDRFSSSSLVTRLTTDITNVQNAFQMIIRMAIRSPMMFISSLIVAFRIDKQLSLIFLVCIPILAVGLYLIMTRTHPTFEKVFKTYDRLNGVVGENLSGIRVVKSFVREKHETEKFGSISEEIYADFSKAEKLLAFNMPLMQFCMYASILFISWFGAKSIVSCGGDAAIGLSTGELMSLFTYTGQILMSLMMLSMVFVMITISRASAERIVEVLDEESDLKNCDNPVTEVKNADIKFENVSFGYSGKKDKLCLKNVNLTIKQGETIGIIGGTGSAKSTLVQLISRLYDTTEGTVTVGGIDVKNYDIETLRDAVATVLQKNVLFSGTIAENLRWGKQDATEEEIIHACRLSQADDFVQKFPNKYNTYIEQGGTNVSGGQKQRLCIARALLKKPKILILDDSTSAVDTKTDASIRRAFIEEIPNTTKLIIAQRTASVMDADRIIVMENGRVAAFDTHDELLKSCDIYREIYESQNKGGGINE